MSTKRTKTTPSIINKGVITMRATPVTKRGQVTIPQPYRKQFSIQEGAKVRFVPTRDIKFEELTNYQLAVEVIPPYDSFIGADIGKGSYKEMVKKLSDLREKQETILRS